MATDVTPVDRAAVLLTVEVAVAAFEAARTAGPADPADFCPPAHLPAHLPAAVELIRADLEFAWEAGRGKTADEYRPHFPAVFADPASLEQVRFEENRLRLAHGRAADDRPPTERVPASRLPGSSNGVSPTDRFPEPGETYLGFRLVRELGRGAFARVYLAEQPELAGRWVALKVSAQLAGESQTLARLQHPNIVPIYSVHRAGRFQAVCMPFFGAATLADVLQGLRAQPALPASGSGFVSTVNQQKDPTVGPAPAAAPPGAPAERPAVENPLARLAGMTHTAAALWVGAELAEGLDHAHARGILHRDIKPANVLLADDGRPMLLDFNLAAAGGGPPDGVGGTPFYMAPEQLAALEAQPVAVDARSDVYSLGLVLYELLTGRPPIDPPSGPVAERLAALRLARVSLPPAARRLNPGVTPATDAILARCLHPDPARRYPSARHLAEDLQSQLADRPLPHAGEPSPRERAGKWLRRHPWARSLPFAAAVVTVVAGLGLGGYLIRTRQYELVRAANTFASLRDDADAARPLLLAPNPSARDLAAGATAGRELLGRYGLPGGDWDQSPLVRRLSAADRMALGRELGTVAALTAGREERRGNLPGAAELSEAAAGLLPNDPFVRRQAERVRAASAGQPLPPSGDGPVAAAETVELAVAELVAARRYREVLGALRAAEGTAGTKPWYWRLRGSAHAELGEWAAAVGCHTAALALRPPDAATVRLLRGQAHLALKDYPDALADFDAAAALTPDDASVYRDRAVARLAAGDHRGAIADLAESERLDPGHTRVHFMRAEAFTRAGDRAAAQRERAEGLKRTPEDATSWVARGVARLNAGDAAGAVADFDRALVLDPLDRQALQNKANALAERLGKPAEAEAVLGRLIDAHPGYVPARGGRAVLLARRGDRAAAHADAVAALRLDPAPFTRYQMAGVYALTAKAHPADKAEALRLLASALQDREGLRYVPTDTDLDPIRGDPAFGRLVAAAKTLAGGR